MTQLKKVLFSTFDEKGLRGDNIERISTSLFLNTLQTSLPELPKILVYVTVPSHLDNKSYKVELE